MATANTSITISGEYEEKTDETLKKLEESKARSKVLIETFSKKAGMLVSKAENDIFVGLDKRHKKGMEAISGIIDEAKKSRELTEELKEKALRTLKKHFVSYCIQDNSDFVLATAKKCVGEGIDGSTLKSFLEALPEPEMFETVKTMKKCLIMDDYDKEEKRFHSDFERVETIEQMTLFLNSTLDVMCARFDRSTKEVKEDVANISRKILEFTESLLEENEKEHINKCDEILEMEEEEEKGYERTMDGDNIEPPKKKAKSKCVNNKLHFPNFGDEFCEWLFYKLIVASFLG